MRLRERLVARVVCALDDARGAIFLYVLFVLTSLLLLAQALTPGELRFAALDRNSTVAFDIAEGGVQEALSPLPRLSAAIPGATRFTNSLARAVPGSSGTVVYETCVSGFCMGSPTIFSILSTASYSGAQRKVRAIEQAAFRPGFGLALIAPEVNFGGDASQFTGDVYALSSVTFLSYPLSPQCAMAATGTIPMSPEVLAGTTIVLGDGSGRGTSFAPVNCPPAVAVKANGTTVSECQTFTLTEVAPTTCAAFGGRAAPYHWHPMTPIGMPAADFATVVSQPRLPPGISVVPATQDGGAVTYTPAGAYAPAYWTRSAFGPLLLVVATQPFCVSASMHAVAPVSPPYPGSCRQLGTGFVYYGASRDETTPFITRFLDWGLVLDDLSRAPHAQTFFQPPAAPPDPRTLVCPAGSPAGVPAGNPCGIRYVPAVPPITAMTQWCAAPDLDQTNVRSPVLCAAAPGPAGGVRFTGTRTAPQTLLIDNSGASSNSPLEVIFSASGAAIPPATPCDQIPFDRYNAGVILAQGDVTLAGSGVFTGFIYSTGTVRTRGSIILRGGIFAANAPVGDGAENAVNSGGPLSFCAAQAADLPLSPQFFALRTLSWQEVPLNRP